MLFNVAFQIGNPKLVSGATWSECAAWAEGVGETIQSINIQQQKLILNNPSSDESYQVGLKDNDTSILTTYIIYDTYSNVISWINAQSGVSVQGIQYQKRVFVQI